MGSHKAQARSGPHPVQSGWVGAAAELACCPAQGQGRSTWWLPRQLLSEPQSGWGSYVSAGKAGRKWHQDPACYFSSLPPQTRDRPMRVGPAIPRHGAATPDALWLTLNSIVNLTGMPLLFCVQGPNYMLILEVHDWAPDLKTNKVERQLQWALNAYFVCHLPAQL